MPKFHLQLLPIVNVNNDYHIEIDDSIYDESKTYFQANSILFKNKFGSVKLKGFFNLSDKNIPSLITINDLSFKISNQILNECIYSFCKYKQEIEFYFSYDDIDYIKNIEEIILKEYNSYIDYDKRIIVIMLNELKNINIKEIIGKFEEEKEEVMNIHNAESFRKKIKEIDNDDIKLNINKISINKNDENIINENINDNNYMENSLDNVEIGENNSKLGNIFTHVSEKTEEAKLETYSDLNANFGKEKKPYIKISNINNKLEYKNDSKNYLNQIQNQKIKNEVNKLISNGAALMKKNSKINCLNQFNINGLYLTLNTNGEKYGNNYNLELNKLILNSDIEDELLPDYNKIIFNNYINILDKVTKDKNKNELDLNDYTYIILTYISEIENEINRINQKQNKSKNDIDFIAKYTKISSILKLFSILFLNCFMYKPENQYLNDKSLFTNSFSDKVMSYRKRLLIEWCMEQQKNLLEKNIAKINISNVENNQKLNYQELYSYGQIKKLMEEPKKRSLFLRSKIANNSEKISKNNMYYFTEFNPLYGEKNRKFNDIFVDKYNNDWISFLVQCLLYEEKRDDYIVYSIELLTKNLENMKKEAKPEIKVNNNIIYDINFILLKLYEQYIKVDIEGQIKYLKMISYSCNISKNNSTDHFIQYIICSTLLKIIEIIFPKDNDIKREITDKIFIKKLVYSLLIQSVEEFLINNSVISSINNYNDYLLVIKLISLSFLNKKAKSKIISDIISRINIPKDSLKFFEENNPLELPEELKYSVLGYTYNSLSLWKEAYNNFISAKKYKLALDACCNYAVEHIKKYKSNSDFKEIFLRFNEIKKHYPSLFIDAYQILFSFVKIMSDDIYILEEKNIYEILNIFNEKEKYLSNDLIDHDVKGIMVDLLYKKLVEVNKGNKIAVGNCELIKKNYVKIETELDILYNIFKDNIELKNKIFS